MYAVILLVLAALCDVECAKCNPATCIPQDCESICRIVNLANGTDLCMNCDNTSTGN